MGGGSTPRPIALAPRHTKEPSTREVADTHPCSALASAESHRTPVLPEPPLLAEQRSSPPLFAHRTLQARTEQQSWPRVKLVSPRLRAEAVDRMLLTWWD